MLNKNDCNLSEVKYNMIKKTVYTDNDTYSSLYYIEYKTNLNSIFMFCIHIQDKINELLDRRMCFVPVTTHIRVSFVYVSFC